jgi:hypothetical protein
MEETFTPEPQAPAEQPQGIVLLQDAQAYLVTAGRWAKFFGILGFIFTGFIVLCALFIGTIISAMASLSPTNRLAGAAPGGFLTVFYLLMGVLNFFIALYLYQFGARVKEGVAFNSSATVTEGLSKLKSMFKLVGILTIVMLTFYLFLIIGVIVFASHMSHGFGFVSGIS